MTGCGIMSSVWGMMLQWGSIESDVKPEQTNKHFPTRICKYRKNPKISNTQKVVVITLKSEQDDFSLE